LALALALAEEEQEEEVNEGIAAWRESEGERQLGRDGRLRARGSSRCSRPSSSSGGAGGGALAAAAASNSSSPSLSLALVAPRRAARRRCCCPPRTAPHATLERDRDLGAYLSSSSLCSSCAHAFVLCVLGTSQLLCRRALLARTRRRSLALELGVHRSGARRAVSA